jgi:CelD/BcsL family acetyltransferase involved in cellulose biosynthesis
LRVVDADAAADPRWDAFVTGHADGLVYHHSAWFDVLERETGRRPFGLVCEDGDGRVRGVLPLQATPGLPLVRGQLTGRRLSSLPRTPVAGPLALDAPATTALVAAAVDRARERGATLQLKVRGNVLDNVVEGLGGSAWSPTFLLELPRRPDDLRFGNSRNHARIRWAVGKAEKLGVRVRPAESAAELRAWYRLYLETMRWHGMPPRPYRLFTALWELLRPRGAMELLLAEHEGRIVAGSVFLRTGRTVVYAFNGRRLRDLSLRPNDLIMWQAIRTACADGFARLDLGEADEPGLIEFKRKWGADEASLYRYYLPAAAGRERLKGGAAGSRLASAAWRRLPLGATVLVSRVAYRYL